MTIRVRRICWPNPDAVCLEGGCVHCNDAPFRTLDTIHRYALRAEPVKARSGAESRPLLEAYENGLRHDFYNAETA